MKKEWTCLLARLPRCEATGLGAKQRASAKRAGRQAGQSAAFMQYAG